MSPIEKMIKDKFGIQVGDTVMFKPYDYDHHWDGTPWVIHSITVNENNQIIFKSKDGQWLNNVQMLPDGSIVGNDIMIEKRYDKDTRRG